MSAADGKADSDDNEIPVVLAEPTPFWKKNAEKLVEGSLDAIEGSAKQFITITGMLQGIYFLAVTFVDIKNASGYSVWIYVAPLILWFLSLLFAVLVLFRDRCGININSSRNSKEVFETILMRKYRLLWFSGVFLIISFFSLIIAFLHYFGAI